MARPFRDRAEGGRRLADRLRSYADQTDVVVLALPRGGVPVAYEVASALNAPLDVFLVRKLGLPGHPELAMGAIASGGVRVLHHDLIERLHVSDHAIAAVVEKEQAELERRERAYRADRPGIDLEGKRAILVDDGLATGASMQAAVRALTQQAPARIVVAVPVAAASSCRDFEREVDEVVCVQTPEPFVAVGYWYEDFAQTSDDEVRALLQRAAREIPAMRGADGGTRAAS